MKDKLITIFNNYGYKNQLKKLNEEIKELKQAIKWYETSKTKDNEELTQAYKDHVAEEIADCFNVIGQFMLAYDIPKNQIKSIMKYKQLRQIERIKNERLQNKQRKSIKINTTNR